MAWGAHPLWSSPASLRVLSALLFAPFLHLYFDCSATRLHGLDQ